MHQVKRIEIIANSFELSKLLKALRTSGIADHAVIRNVAGTQQHGGKEDLDMLMIDNVYILAYCDPENLKGAIETIRPLLNKFGGSCHISDALEVRSMNCIEKL
ncbi:MAG: P-II family nitrogen regulator [Acaryochloridaceae cyanobacterium RL_2_7]|nr:P-II family nitrogen regulator [Acaryochloridaceae cyanobacterium RL_2_7]